MGKRVIILGLTAIMLSIGGVVFAQTMVTLDQAISYSANEIETRLEPGVKVMVLNFKSPSQRLSNYMLDEMTNMLTRSGRLTTVEKANLEFLLRELRYERSGDISDEAAQSIGRILGAQYVVSGLIEEYTANYVIQFKTMPVEPTALQTLTRVGVIKDIQITNLLSNETPGQTRTEASGQTVGGNPGVIVVGSDLTDRIVLSTGGGAYGKYDFLHFSAGGESELESSISFGGSISLNAELFSYLLLDLSVYYRYQYGGLSSISFEGDSNTKIGSNTIGAAFSLFGQYPISLTDRITLFPLLGIGYDMPFFMFTKDGNGTRDGNDLDFLYIKPGIRLNYNFAENLRLDARFVYDYLIYNKWVSYIKGLAALGGGTIINHGPGLFLGVNYVFLRN